MALKPATPAAMQLLMEGSLAMARMEATGIRIDVPYLDKAIDKARAQLLDLKDAIKSAEEYQLWRREFGNSMNLTARAQLGRVLFDVVGYKRNKFMGQSNSEGAFEHLKEIKFKDDYFKIQKLEKALGTYLLGIRREVVDGRIHPFFNLAAMDFMGEEQGGAESYRSTSSRPNLQNQPVRNKWISKVVRACMIPSPGCVFLEADYSTQEVHTAYCYNQDPKLLYDIEHGDMHKDRALELFKLTEEEYGNSKEEPGKLIRYIAKNKFVFAQFYGSYHSKCAPDLWDSISLYNLKTTKGISLYEHLKGKGVKKLGACEPGDEPVKGTYEYLVKEVQTKMWEETYTVYNQWKKDWWELYLRQGGVNSKTGFKMEGVFRRNQILCECIQGSAFHCLLWSIIQIQKKFIKYKMKSKVVVQVHDSILIDARKKELKNVVEIVKETMLNDVRKHWKWIICPLGVELEIAKKNWFEKIPYAA